MRGDFSAWNKDRSHNFRGTLHQQGRVLLDRDWNAQTEIIGEWQETAARDAFGAGVAAVPAEESLSFKVMRAKNVAAGGGKPAHVEIGLKKGRVWADGLLAELFRDAPSPLPADWPGVDAVRTATYLGPPIQAAPLPGAVPAVGDRDAVILETWLEELSPFQNPDLLIEPALGGVDTTERVQTAFRFRLYRMGPNDTCHSIANNLKDNFSAKGKLTAELKPATATGGDCPVVLEGGFTGFEHRLYRIEIADTDRPSPQAFFKWSHFNGGLVGTGDFDNSVPASPKVIIHGNKNAIVYSGSSNFYLEALDFDAALGCWKVVYGAKATLGTDGKLDLKTAAADIYKGTIPPALPGGKKRFFRLWNGIERVNDFVPAKKDLPDNLGIMLQFEAEAVGKYTPSDFWTFEARAEGIGNPLVLIPNLPPQGIFYHRVPLAEVHWTSNNVTGDDIEDCRLPFQPLTKLKTCCTYRVGDGINSHGDFKKIQDAINALPKKGGEVCILPGIYVENVVVKSPHNRNIILKGCGRRTVIRAKDHKEYKDDPELCAAIYVRHGQNVTIESLAVEAHEEGFGIFLEGTGMDARGAKKGEYLTNIMLSGLFVSAVQKSGIRAHTAQNLTLSCSAIYILEDKHTHYPAVYLGGDDMLIERTEIRVLPNFTKFVGGTPTVSALGAAIGNIETVGELIDVINLKAGNKNPFLSNDPDTFADAQAAPGGLQIAGGSERVRIINNLIVGGRGNGITLGNIDLEKDGEVTPNNNPFTPRGSDDPCYDDDGHTGGGEEDEEGYRAFAGPPLYDILIKFNRIFNMGRNGIGVASFFDLGQDISFDSDNGTIGRIFDATKQGIISVAGLVICENRIERCLSGRQGTVSEEIAWAVGYAGISLADVLGLVIRDNFIVNNGPDYLQPVCGIFVLIGEGVEISRNNILNNGIRTKAELNSKTIKIGPRGGIWIAYATTGQIGIDVSVSEADGSNRGGMVERLGILPVSSGEPAAKIQENVVVAPLGKSLTLMANGPVSVVGNQFTTMGMEPVNVAELFKKIINAGSKLNFWELIKMSMMLCGNIFIFDLGFNILIEDMVLRQVAGALASGNIVASSGSIKNTSLGERMIHVFGGGAVLFSNNQCRMNLMATGKTFAAAAIMISSIDDVGFHNNQSDCNLGDDFIIANTTITSSFTCRVTDNRFVESMDLDPNQKNVEAVFEKAIVSAHTNGSMNITSDNESTRCLRIEGELFLSRHNLIYLEKFFGGASGDIAKLMEKNDILMCQNFSLEQMMTRAFEKQITGQ